MEGSGGWGGGCLRRRAATTATAAPQRRQAQKWRGVASLSPATTASRAAGLKGARPHEAALGGCIAAAAANRGCGGGTECTGWGTSDGYESDPAGDRRHCSSKRCGPQSSHKTNTAAALALSSTMFAHPRHAARHAQPDARDCQRDSMAPSPKGEGESTTRTAAARPPLRGVGNP